MTVETAIAAFAQGTKRAVDQGYALGPVYASKSGNEVMISLEDRSGSVLTAVIFEDEDSELEDLQKAFRMIAKIVS